MPELDDLLTKDDLRALLRSAKQLNRMGTLESVLGEILSLAADLANSEAGSVLLLDRDREDLYFSAAIGAKAAEVMLHRVPLEGSIAGEVFRTQQSRTENHIERHYEAVDDDTGFQSKSMICVPLVHAGEVKGVMQLLNKNNSQGYGDHDLALLERLGGQAALAIQNAELYEQLISSSGLFARPEVRQPYISLLTAADQAPIREEFTVLFADIRGFTKLCAGHAPERIKRMLDEYFTGLTDVVIQHDGIVNKLVGDGILAIFGGEHQSSNAALAGLALITTFDQLRRRWDEQTRESLAFLDLGIGIARDDLVLGRVGRANCFDFTVIGHGVNFASALCDHARDGNRILCDQLFKHALEQDGQVPCVTCRKLEPIFLANLAKEFDAYLLEPVSAEYDVFLSYRRERGGEAAHAFAAGLDGQRVFLDVNSLRVGRYAPLLASTIAVTPSFVVLLTKGSLDTCGESGDWLTKEIGEALRARRRIIPIVWPDFEWPATSDLPEEIRDLPSFEAVPYQHTNFAGTLEKLKLFLADRGET